MSDSPKAVLAASVAAGYLLGRSRKAKLAIAVATFMVSGRLQSKPQELLASGLGRLGDSPQFAQLADQVRDELLTVGREALKTAVDRRLGTFADSLADRTSSLNGAGRAIKGVQGGEDDDGDDRGERDEAPDEGEDSGGEPEEEAEEEEEGGRGEEGRRRPPREGRDEQAAPPRKRAKKAAGKPAAKKAAAKKAPAKKAPPKKAAKKTGGRKTASNSSAEQRRRR